MDDVTPLSSSAAAEQTLWSSDFWRDCMAPKIVTFKVPNFVLSLLMVSPRALHQTLNAAPVQVSYCYGGTYAGSPGNPWIHCLILWPKAAFAVSRWVLRRCSSRDWAARA